MNEIAQEGRVIDLGCGPNKVEGAFGVDHHPYEGIDQVADLEKTPWPLPSDSFDHIYARHVIEHVVDIKAFMKEIHRIGRNGAICEITTPHYSSKNSFSDPTHIRHMSSTWHEAFTKHYLMEQMPGFSHVETEVNFGSNVRNIIPKLMVKLKGYEWWEKHYAFVYPGRNVHTILRVVK